GLHKHKWSLTVKTMQEHFGKTGFKTHHRKEVSVINLDQLERISEKLVEEKKAVKEGDVIKIDVTKLGYQKVLGSGKLSKPLIVQEKVFSKSAEKKLNEIGGKAEKI